MYLDSYRTGTDFDQGKDQLQNMGLVGHLCGLID